MIRLEYKTQTQVETNRAEIAAAMAAYEAAGGEITVLEGFQYVERPKPTVNHKIHSERQQAEKRIRAGKVGKPRTPPEKRAEIAQQLKSMASAGMAKWTAIESLTCGRELAIFIIEEHGIVWPARKTMKDVADAFCGVTV